MHLHAKACSSRQAPAGGGTVFALIRPAGEQRAPWRRINYTRLADAEAPAKKGKMNRTEIIVWGSITPLKKTQAEWASAMDAGL
jgi:hypothetical protein